jgi:hypothetical protein
VAKKKKLKKFSATSAVKAASRQSDLNEPPQPIGVIPRAKIIEPCFEVTFFVGKFAAR